MTSKERCLAALAGRPVDRVPVFPLLMSFASRRLGVTYREFAANGGVMAEAQLLIRERFGIDAITACSDAFRICADLGAEIVFPDDTPPFAAAALVRNRHDLDQLGWPDPTRPGSRMADRARGVREMVQAAGDDCLVLGWVDMPFAEACSLCGVAEFMLMLYDDPGLAHAVLEFLTPIVAEFARLQLETGAPMIGAGDAAASLLSPELYREFVLPCEQQVCTAIHGAGGLVKLHICGSTASLIPDMIRSGADLFNVDHLVDFRQACTRYGNASRCFKGNLNPVAEVLQSSPEACEKLALVRLRQAAGCRYMLSPGCEVPGETPDEIFAAFCHAPQMMNNDQ